VTEAKNILASDEMLVRTLRNYLRAQEVHYSGTFLNANILPDGAVPLQAKYEVTMLTITALIANILERDPPSSDGLNPWPPEWQRLVTRIEGVMQGYLDIKLREIGINPEEL
jgi:hypothetical protein